jgi:predicted lipoprotein with Yx(FWY)xxD motif
MNGKLFVAGAFTVITVLATGCGSSPSTAAASPSPSPSPSPVATGTKVAVANNAKLGQILVDDKGMTLYLFVKDTGTSSTCYDQCAAIWPPLFTTGTPQAGAGATQSLLGTTTRTDGKVEVTCAGHPLYYFIKDKAPGDVTGQGVNGFGGLWWVVTPSGAANTTM